MTTKSRTSIILFFIVFILISVAADCYYHDRVAYKPSEGIGWMCFNDFRVFWQASYNLYHYVTGKNASLAQYPVYDIREKFYHFRYSPFVAFIMLPFGISPYPAYMLIIWHIIVNISFLAALLVLVRQIYRDFEVPHKYQHLILWGTFFISLRFYLMNISLGQTDTLLALLFVLMLMAYLKNKEIFCGILLALILQFKILYFPVLFYFLLTKKIKLIASTIIGFVILLFMPAILLGFDTTITLIKGWLEILSLSVPSQILNPKNQSLTYAIGTLLLKNPIIKNRIGAENLFYFTGALLTLVSYAAFTLAGRILYKKNEKIYKYREVSLVIIISLIFSPIIWEAHFMSLLVPIGTAMLIAVKTPGNRLVYALLGIFVFFSCLLGTDLTKFIPAINSLHFTNISIGTLFLAALLLTQPFPKKGLG